MKALVLLLCLLFAATPQVPVRDSPARSLATSPGAGLIAGVVVSAEASKTPLRRVTLALSAGDGFILNVVTDDKGTFAFTELPPGRYTLTATKPGYLATPYGATRPGRPGSAVALAAGQQLTNLSIAMPKGAVITGRLITESGEPAAEARVTPLVFGISPTGERTLLGVGLSAGQRVDDRGQFRLYGLAPGDYVLMAVPSANGQGVSQTTEADYQRALDLLKPGATLAAPVGPGVQRTFAPVPVFYPGTLAAGEAQTIRVGLGEERSGLSLVVRQAPAGRIDGTVTGVDGRPAANITATLIEALQMSPGMSNRAVTDTAGRFSLTGVPPGRYSVIARMEPGRGRGAGSGPNQTLWAQADVVMDGSDTSVSMTLTPGVTVSGTIKFESSGVTTAPANFSSVRVSLVPVVSATGVQIGVVGVAPDASGAFAVTGVTPGRYRVEVSSPGSVPGTNAAWVVRSAMLQGRDVSEDPMDIGSVDVAGIEVAMGDRPTELSGMMLDASGQPAPEYYLIVFPKDPALRLPRSLRILQTRPGADGRYQFRGLRPGEYLLAGLTDVQPGEWYDPAFLQQIAPAAVSITLAAGERRVQDIRVK